MSPIAKALLTCATLLVAAAATPVLADGLHFALDRSVPSAGETVAAPGEITLWFTQVPQENSISIRLVDARGDLVASSDPRQDAQDATSFSIAPEGTLSPGAYTVAWRGIGQDGHTVRGDFAFTVRAP